jgi:hypothetical protein
LHLDGDWNASDAREDVRADGVEWALQLNVGSRRVIPERLVNLSFELSVPLGLSCARRTRERSLEFQSFASDSFASILSEARKYRLSLILSHQFTDQVRPEIRQAVFGNVGSIISFRVGQSDAEILEREFGHTYPQSQFTHLGNHEVCVKLMMGGQQPEPFVGKTLPPGGHRYGRRETIVMRSRLKYATEKEIVEDRIRRWLGEFQR